MNKRSLAPAGLAAAALVIAACGSSGNSANPGSTKPPASPTTNANTLKTMTINGTMVVTDAKGLTLYSFAPDTPTTSKCNGTCAGVWPPVQGPATAGAGITGKLGTITRADGATQATYNGHPVYTYTGDTAPGQANGNGLNVQGGVWHEVTNSGAGSPAPSHSGSSGGNGY
jgi:predicted lipoprotein with Yx(FWY)xxD motif